MTMGQVFALDTRLFLDRVFNKYMFSISVMALKFSSVPSNTQNSQFVCLLLISVLLNSTFLKLFLTPDSTWLDSTFVKEVYSSGKLGHGWSGVRLTKKTDLTLLKQQCHVLLFKDIFNYSQTVLNKLCCRTALFYLSSFTSERWFKLSSPPKNLSEPGFDLSWCIIT